MPKGIRNPKPVEAAPEEVEHVAVEVIAAPAPAKAAAPIEDLAVYAARIERQAQPFAVCKIIHPNAVTGTVFDGVYSGIRLEQGAEMSAQLSNGAVI